MFDKPNIWCYNKNMKKNIDDKLQLVYNFTVDYIDSNGFPPSVREICAKCNIKSTASAYVYLERLKEKGLLIKSPQKKRTLQIASNKKDFRSIPLVGTIRAGAPIFALENLEGYIPLPSDFSGDDCFALKVQGDSMCEAGIYENDIIIVSKCNYAENGDMVVALVEDSATVKTFYKRNDKIVLHPENSTMEDMIFDDVQILGKVKGLLRKFN